MKLLFPLFCLAILLSACSNQASVNAGPQKIALIGPDEKAVTVTVEIADDPQERQMGLMNREALNPDSGMLFIFDAPAVLTFWMKDTLIPLDIIFFGSQGELLGGETMLPCEEDPCEKFNSPNNSSLALEVPAGFQEFYGIGEGWRIALPVK
jgi:uncharacterized membrane protein (UPF0127 family)